MAARVRDSGVQLRITAYSQDVVAGRSPLDVEFRPHIHEGGVGHMHVDDVGPKRVTVMLNPSTSPLHGLMASGTHKTTAPMAATLHNVLSNPRGPKQTQRAVRW